MIADAPRRAREAVPRNRSAVARRRRGAGLIEILIAIIIFGLVATSHALVTQRLTTSVKAVKTGAARSAALQEYVVRLFAVPFDSLPGRAGCTTTSTGALPNTRCVSVAIVTSTKKTVTLIFTPTNSTFLPDTVVITRTKISSGLVS
jgi:type II secretory pathway pseudopilin PulG